MIMTTQNDVDNSNNLNDVFDLIYSQNSWYGGGSGEGSTVEFNKATYIPFLKNYLSEHQLKTVADIGSGDGQCLIDIYGDMDVKYFGYDCSKFIVTRTKERYENHKYHFELIDGNNPFVYIKKEVDLVIVKDVLQHWSNARIHAFLSNLKKNVTFKKCLLINDLTHDTMTDIEDGKWRCINWKDPFFSAFTFNPCLVYGSRLLKEVVEFENKDTVNFQSV